MEHQASSGSSSSSTMQGAQWAVCWAQQHEEGVREREVTIISLSLSHWSLCLLRGWAVIISYLFLYPKKEENYCSPLLPSQHYHSLCGVFCPPLSRFGLDDVGRKEGRKGTMEYAWTENWFSWLFYAPHHLFYFMSFLSSFLHAKKGLWWKCQPSLLIAWTSNER